MEVHRAVSWRLDRVMSRLHRVHQSQYVKAMLREERRANAGTPNLQGSVSYFHQTIADDCPTSEEVKSSVQWGKAESNDGTFHRWGPDLLSVLAKLPP
jgi:hypothetical protein